MLLLVTSRLSFFIVLPMRGPSGKILAVFCFLVSGNTLCFKDAEPDFKTRRVFSLDTGAFGVLNMLRKAQFFPPPPPFLVDFLLIYSPPNVGFSPCYCVPRDDCGWYTAQVLCRRAPPGPLFFTRTIHLSMVGGGGLCGKVPAAFKPPAGLWTGIQGAIGARRLPEERSFRLESFFFFFCPC